MLSPRIVGLAVPKRNLGYELGIRVRVSVKGINREIYFYTFNSNNKSEIKDFYNIKSLFSNIDL